MTPPAATVINRDGLEIARAGERLSAVLGPTNTGKTHLAVSRMLGHASGMIGLPLRLLAREVYDRVVAKLGPSQAALITGEEKIIPAAPRFFICTVESMPLERRVDFLAVDEIQLAADPERGHIFTERLLRARGDQETMFLGADTMRGVLRQILPGARFVSRPRFSDLSYTGPRKLSRLPRRSAVVAFSAEAVYGLAELIRRHRGGAAVVMGALSPRTRNAQVALYQSGDVDFLVATDAIGMGLNMDVDHVAFASVTKFDGAIHRPLRAAEIAQIAGRAGRHMNDGTFGPTGEVPPFEAPLVEQIEQHRFDPVRVLQWRNPHLDFSSIPSLITSLEAPPPVRGLTRGRAAVDLDTLKLVSLETDIAALARAPAAIGLLWEVCQIPDFRKSMLDAHVRLVGEIYRHLMGNDGVLPTDWVARHVERIDVTEGDIDTLSARIAQTRTWTYVAHRAGWLADPAHWQERTRAIEDTLSDALHAALTQRFVDRRTSVLMKRLRQQDELSATVAGDGEVLVEGEYVGRLNGFQFVADRRGMASEIGPKMLRHAAARALAPEIGARAVRLAGADDRSLQLSEHGKLWWEGSPVAQLVAGGSPLTPRVELLADDILSGGLRDRVQARLDQWTRAHIDRVLAPLVALRDAEDITGLARGLAFQLVENLGSLPRTEVADELRALDQPARSVLRRYGIRFGAQSVFLPILIKPAAAGLKVLLWVVHQGQSAKALRLPSMPAPGLVSAPVETGVPHLFYERAGFRVCGGRAVRIDMLERLADMLRPPRPVAGKKPVPPAGNGPDTNEKVEAERIDRDGRTDTGPIAVDAATPVSAESFAPDHEAPFTDPGDQAGFPNVTDGPNHEAEISSKPSPFADDGSFAITSDMMSVVGVSGAEFEALLRALGYRSVERRLGEEQGDAEREPLRWRLKRSLARSATGGKRPVASGAARSAKTRAPEPHKNPGHEAARPVPAANETKSQKVAGSPKRKRKGGAARFDQTASEAPGSRTPKAPRHQKNKEPAIDPDSPFAALAVLKQSMTKGR